MCVSTRAPQYECIKLAQWPMMQHMAANLCVTVAASRAERVSIHWCIVKQCVNICAWRFAFVRPLFCRI